MPLKNELLFEESSESSDKLQTQISLGFKHPAQSTFSRDEMNLAEFPLTVLSTRANPALKTLEFTDTHRLKNGEIVERKWIITGADKFGLPTSTDDDVLLGLMRLTMDQGFRSRKVYFTRYELMKALRWSTEGRSYSRLTKSLDRLSGVRIRASNAFFDNSSKAYQTRNFGIIDAYEINDERNVGKLGESEGTEKNGEGKGSFFFWSEVLFDSFQSGFIKKLDLEMYFNLKSAISRRLYRYLDKHFYYKNVVEKPLMTMAFEKLGLSRNYRYVSSVKQQLEPAAEELVAAGFLSGFEFVGKGSVTMARFYKANPVSEQRSSLFQNGSARNAHSANAAVHSVHPVPPQVVHQPEVLPPSAPVERARSKQSSLVEALISRGLTFTQSASLVTGKSEAELDRAELIVDYYDQLVSTNDPKVGRNKIGFLYRAVENPTAFTLPGERVAQEPKGSSLENTRKNRPELRIVRAKREERQEYFRMQKLVRKEPV